MLRKPTSGSGPTVTRRRSTRNSPANPPTETEVGQENQLPPLQGKEKPFENQDPQQTTMLQEAMATNNTAAGYHHPPGPRPTLTGAGPSGEPLAADHDPRLTAKIVAAIKKQNQERGMIIGGVELGFQISAYVSNCLSKKIPFPNYSNMTASDKRMVQNSVRGHLKLSDDEYQFWYKHIEQCTSKALRDRRSDAITRGKDVYLGRQTILCPPCCNVKPWLAANLTACLLCSLPFPGLMRLQDPDTQALKRSSFLVIDTESVGKNHDIVHRCEVDDNGRPVVDEIQGRRLLPDDDDTVDPRQNYNEEKEVDMFENFDDTTLHVVAEMKKGTSGQGFKLLAYIIVNFMLEFVKCTHSRECLKKMHPNIFTWLSMRQLAYALTLTEHLINR